VLPGLPSFLEAYPEIELHISEGDRLADLIREGIDCVLRVGEPKDSDMIARRVALLDEVTLASPIYLKQFGTPASLEVLAKGHRMVGFRSTATGGLLPLEFVVDGKVRNIMLPATVSVSAAESYVAAAKLGLGLIQVPRYHAEASVKSGKLIEVLRKFPPTPTPVSLLYPRNRQLSPRVRVFLDWVAGEFAAQRAPSPKARQASANGS
jgi:DNA-binding transcriptional LysR family regulator